LGEAVKRRSGGVCERCHKNYGSHTHHWTYIRKYRERLEDLGHLCVGCHEFETGLISIDPSLLPGEINTSVDVRRLSVWPEEVDQSGFSEAGDIDFSVLLQGDDDEVEAG
jgi:hypothetical protein